MEHKILERLDKVRQTSSHSWRARCPVHGRGHDTLAIRVDDKRLLIHCFAGCTPAEIVDALGLEMSDLFKDARHHEKGRAYKDAREDLKVMKQHTMKIWTAKSSTKPLSADDKKSIQESWRILVGIAEKD